MGVAKTVLSFYVRPHCYVFGVFGGEFHQFGFGGGRVGVVVSDIEDVGMGLDLMVEVISADYLVDADLS
jgi:hypothetical protein